MVLERFTVNNVGPTRRETLEGRSYIVAPMIILVEGVLNGSRGPLFYPNSEMNKTPVVWDHKPVVKDHPMLNGEGISACSPQIIESHKVGMMLNTKYDPDGSKLRSEAWIDEEKAKQVFPELLTSLEKNELREVSTGLFTDNEDKKDKFNGKEYIAIARNYRPDHLAILTGDKKGACSNADGAGLLANAAMSHSKIRQGIHRELGKQTSPSTTGFFGGGYVEDVYNDFFIHSDESGMLHKQGYKINGDNVELGGKSEPVQKVTEYRSMEGSFIGNVTTNALVKGTTMTKKEIVDGLIANGGWKETDREWLTGQSDEHLTKMIPPKPPVPVPAPAPTGNAALPTVITPVPIVTNTPAPTGNAMSVDQYVQNAPPEVQDMLRNGLILLNQERAVLIQKITSNQQNKFTPEFLQTKGTPELQMLAALAAPPPNYAGAGGAPPLVNGSMNGGGAPTVKEPLGIPVMNWKK